MNLRTAFRAAIRTTVGAAALIVATTAPASAQIIDFTHSGFAGSGSLNGVNFVDKLFTISARGNILNREVSFGVYSIEHDVATIDIQDLGSFTFLTGTRTFTSPLLSRAGFGRQVGGDLFNFIDGNTVPLATWTMSSSIGPLIGTSRLLQWGGALEPIVTDGGVLFFTADEDVSSSFSASTRFSSNPDLDPNPVPVPEPSSFALLPVACVALTFRYLSCRRRYR